MKLIDNAEKYVGSQDISWWDSFFLDQRKIIECRLQAHWPITLPFSWALGMMNPTLCSNPIPDELKKLVHPEQRDIYMGP